VWKPKGKRPLGRPRHRWYDITMDCQEAGRENMDWIDLARDRDRWQVLVNVETNIQVP
jgi:hypothetical protein